MWHKSLRISVALVVMSTLLIMALSAEALAAKPVIPLQVDVWCNKGGQGPGASGGTFQVGEIPIIYFTVNHPCQFKLILNGPGGSNAWSGSADYGQTYQYKLGIVESSDAGTWQVTLQANDGLQVAQDIVTFTIAGSSSTPAPSPLPTTPSPQTSVPGPAVPPKEQAAAVPATPGSTGSSSTATVNADTATETAALMALRMARGEIPADLKLDANGDNKITDEDAKTILKWSVTGYGGDVSTAQQEIIDAFGYPEQFSVSYLLDSQTEFNAMVRSEIWMYPQHQKKVTFVGGEIYATDDLPPLANPGSSCSKLKPQDVDYFTTADQIEKKVGGTVAKTDFLPEMFEQNKVESYLGRNVMFVIANGHLVHLQTFCTTPDGISINIEGIRNLLAEANPFFARPVEARWNPWRDIKKGVRFLVKLPEKVTSAILPPELAPFAAALIEMKLGNLNAWRAAVQLNNLGQLDDNVKKARDGYRQEANRLNDQLNALRAERDRLYGTGPTELGLNPRDWMDRKHTLDELIPRLEQAYGALNNAANSLSRNNLANMALSNVIKQTLGNVKNVALNEVRNEIGNLNNGNVVLAFLDTRRGIMNGRGLVDFWLDGDIRRTLGNRGSDTALVDRIRQSILNQIKQDAENVRRNWQQVLENAIAQATSAGDKASSTVPQVPQLAEPPFKLAQGQFVSGSGSGQVNIDKFVNLFIQEVLPKISIDIDSKGKLSAQQTVPVNISAPDGQISGNAAVKMEGQFINNMFTGTFNVNANTVAQGAKSSTPLDLIFSGSFTSPMLLADSEGKILPITLSFTGPARSKAIIEIYATLLKGIKEAFSFGAPSDKGQESEKLPSDTLCRAYTCKVTYSIQQSSDGSSGLKSEPVKPLSR
jgi:hypothetical protein